MLSISTINGQEYSWHVGELNAARILRTEIIDNVKEFQADGHELERVKLNFPCYDLQKPVARFYGDEAKTILWNILY